MTQLEDDKPWLGPLPAMPDCDCHICRPDASYDELDRRTIDSVLEHGWQVIMVGANTGCSHPQHQDHSADDHSDPGPAFAYTVGLGHRFGHPELLMSGLDHRVMHRALNNVAQRVMSGRRLAPGDVLEDVLAGVPVALEQVADEALRDTVSWSGWFHRRKPEALSLVWPDRNGVFAWQPGAPESLEDLQPGGWRVPIEHTAGLATDAAWDFPVPPDRTVAQLLGSAIRVPRHRHVLAAHRGPEVCVCRPRQRSDRDRHPVLRRLIGVPAFVSHEAAGARSRRHPLLTPDSRIPPAGSPPLMDDNARRLPPRPAGVVVAPARLGITAGAAALA